MDTLLILRDTVSSHAVILKDAITTHVVKVVDNCQPCVHGVETNWQDFTIAAIICVSTIVIACYGIKKFFGFKKDEREARTTAENKKRNNDVDDRERQQKIDLIEKLLDFLKNKASEKKDNKKQQSNNKSLSITEDEVYNLLKENATRYCTDDLRKKYIELCVSILQQLKHDAEAKPEDKDASDASSENKMSYESQYYIRVLKALIENDAIPVDTQK